MVGGDERRVESRAAVPEFLTITTTVTANRKPLDLTDRTLWAPNHRMRVA
jgi:hypothetical protein